jgi:hypothetical protein
MSDDPRFAMRDLVDDHLGRRSAVADVGVFMLVTGLATIGAALSEIQAATGNWSSILANLRAGVRDTRAALDFTAGDASLQRVRDVAARMLAFASSIEPDVARLAG